MANIKMSGGHKQEAIQLLEQCVAQWRAALPEGSAQIGVGLNNTAYTFHDLGQLERAAELFEETVRIRIAKLEPDHLLTLKSRENLAYVYLDMGRHAEAVREFRAVWEARKAALGPSHNGTFNSQGRLALSLIALEQFEEAEAILLDKWGLLHAQGTPNAGWVKLTRKRLLLLYEAWGKPEAANPYRLK